MGEHAVPARNSIAGKYRIGYLILLAMTVLVFLASTASSLVNFSMYNRAVDDLLELNELFIDVENTNSYLYDYFLYLRVSSSEGYKTEAAKTRNTVELLQQRMHEDYSRDIMDLCCMAETYLEKSGNFVEGLDQYVSRNPDSTQVVGYDSAYNDIQTVVGYINQSFREIYSEQLVRTEEIQSRANQLRLVGLGIVAALVAAAAGIYVMLYHRVILRTTQSLQSLTAFAQTVIENPGQCSQVELNTGDELELFARTFNKMLATIRRQMEQLESDSLLREQLRQAEVENLRISAALKANELALLQSRINPHFLFNTLNMIMQTAQMEEADETANLIEVTAEFLRYNLGRLNKITTLGDEVENTKNYVYIQERRFGDRYRFTFEVDESCAGYHVPSMILQPLVENSIRHGLQDRLSGAQIAVRIYRRPPEHICLEVWDNGTGISPEKQAELRRSFAANDDGGHIGLRNVYKRLTLLWGQEVTFEFDSVPGDSAVRIVLPLHDALPDAGDRNAQKGGKEAECPSTDC